MNGTIFVYIGSIVITIWGIAHIIPTKSVVSGYGNLSVDNKRILIMEWVSEGLTLCFIGVLAFLTAALFGTSSAEARFLFRAFGVILLVMAFWTLITGARTPKVVFRICPIAKSAVAVLFFIGSAV